MERSPSFEAGHDSNNSKSLLSMSNRTTSVFPKSCSSGFTTLMIVIYFKVVIMDVYNNEGKFLVRFSNKFTQTRCRVPLPSNPDLLSHAKYPG